MSKVDHPLDLLITPALDTHLLETAEEREPDGYWHPSSLWGCDRQAVYLVRGTPETDPKEAADYRPLAMGKALHTLVQAAVKPGNGRIVRAWHEVKVRIPKLNITGSADSVVELACSDENGEWVEYEVEEFKSTKSIALKYAKGDKYPKANHIGQALIYTYGMRYFNWFTEYIDDMGVTITEEHQPLGGKLKRCRITYLGKDNFEVMEYLVDITPEWEARLLAYIANLEKYREDGEALPPRLARDDKGAKNWLCGYCQFRTRCWDEDGEGVEL